MWPVVTYGCEAWIMKKEDCKIHAAELSSINECYKPNRLEKKKVEHVLKKIIL